MVKSSRNRSALRRKLARDMRQNCMQFLAMFLLCFLGTWVFAGLDANWRTEERTIETWLSEGELSDLWVRGAGFSRQDVYRLEALESVALVQPRIDLSAECPDLPGQVTAAVHAFSGGIRLNIPLVRSGEGLNPGDARGCLVEEQFARAQGLSPGDRLTLRLAGADYTFVVRGTVLSPEYLITSKDIGSDPATFGFVLISADALPQLPFNALLVRLREGADAQEAERAVSALLPRAVVISQASHAATVQARNFVHLFRNMSYLFPVLAYFVAFLVVMSTVSRMMDTQRIQMGTLKALGYNDRQIRRHYLSYALWPSLLGSLIGLISAQYILVPVLWNMVAVHIRVPAVLPAPISPLAWGMAAAEVIAAVLLCMHHERKAARASAAELLRPKPPRAGARILLERIGPVWRRFSFNAKMIVRNLFRNKGRTLMSMFGMLFCNMLIICSFGLQESIPYFIDAYFHGTLDYDVRVNLEAAGAGMLESYRSRLDAQAVDGLMDMSVSLRTAERTRTVLLTVLPEDTALLRLGENHTALALPPEGLMITRKLASAMNLKAGDSAEVWLTGETKPVVMTVAGTVESNIGQTAYLSRTAWERLRKGGFVCTALLVKNPTERGLEQLEQMDEASDFIYPDEQTKQTRRFMDSATGAFSILSGVALGLAFIICYNMGLLNFTERTREYATLKVLGYHQREIRRLMLHENTLTAVVGVGLGIVPGILLVAVILRMCEFDSMVFEAHVTWPTWVLSSVITFAFTWLIEWLLTRKVRKIDMVEALKSVE